MATKLGLNELYFRDDKPFGNSWEEWTVKWWQWIISIPKHDNPGYDTTGKKSSCGMQQHPNLIFLAGTYGGYAERCISIPSGTAMFLPVINCTTSFLEDPSHRTEDDLTTFVSSNIDDILIKSASIDGIEVENLSNYRVRSPIFQVIFPPGNIYNVEPCKTKAASDGFWLFVKPMTLGVHQIRTFGSCMAGRIKIGVTYNIAVNDERKVI